MTATRWRRPIALATAVGLAALALLAVGVLPARAAGDDAQIGTPNTDSAVTLRGDSAFPSLRVTVSQTRNLTHQVITIRWSGLPPTDVSFGAQWNKNYLSVMQCWGDDPTAPAGPPRPARETCQQGGAEPYSYTGPVAIGSMTRRVDDQDPAEVAAAGADGKPLHYYDDIVKRTAQTPYTIGAVPFQPVQSGWPTRQDPDQPPWINQDSTDNRYFDLTTTNEIPAAVTHADGTGVETFEVQTGIEAPGLGCGLPQSTSDHRPRGCWLAIVPHPDTSAAYDVNSLSMSTWRHALATRLQFTPVQSNCGLGRSDVRLAGSELVTDATTSWSSAICAQTGTPYTYTQMPEDQARRLATSSNAFGGAPTRLAMTYQPMPSVPGQPVAYAPTAVSGFVIGFVVERNPTSDAPASELRIASTRVASLRLDQRLVAKLLSQSYQDSIMPGGVPRNLGNVYDGQGKQFLPAQYLLDNPARLTQDPEFLQLNPEFRYLPGTTTRSDADLLVPQQNSDVATALWRWVLADPDARAWLGGKPDPWGMVVNPNFRNLVSGATSDYPKPDPTCYILGLPSSGQRPLCGLDVHPYMLDMHAAATNVVRGTTGAKLQWQVDPAPGKYVDSSGPETVTRRFMLAVTDAASAARNGLQTASLRNAAGQYVAPDVSSLLAGVSAMTPSADPRVLQLDPSSPQARAVAGAYPGTMLTYAAVPLAGLDAPSRSAYAAYLRYVAGAGQAMGYAPGDLPPGYAPLTASLRTQALTEIGRAHV